MSDSNGELLCALEDCVNDDQREETMPDARVVQGDPLRGNTRGIEHGQSLQLARGQEVLIHTKSKRVNIPEGYGFRPMSGASTPLTDRGEETSRESPLPDPNGLGWPGECFHCNCHSH